MILACIDGGLICIPLMILTAVGLGWCAKCIRKHILRKKDGECGACVCPCHEDEEDVKEEEGS